MNAVKLLIEKKNNEDLILNTKFQNLSELRESNLRVEIHSMIKEFNKNTNSRIELNKLFSGGTLDYLDPKEINIYLLGRKYTSSDELEVILLCEETLKREEDEWFAKLEDEYLTDAINRHIS
ncbi:hypothetical protein BTXL6_10995 [Bacillus thuringiensis]|nr:hypothetical protein BTXL6_28560 [Bacillus thuringiensis]ALL21946.1 hypothetical protein BTXL6_10995 [Bacillus thuringiensis]EEM19262.1 hypothetical protein bthur0001_56270 [Bacillus thuringiensis serovar tochigiensis BGSC 4Y1]